jgi:hypothetical protein
VFRRYGMIAKCQVGRVMHRAVPATGILNGDGLQRPGGDERGLGVDRGLSVRAEGALAECGLSTADPLAEL